MMNGTLYESKSVCIIGSGPSGLTAIKQCLDQNLFVTCFEKTDSIGGLWRYREESINGVGSVMKSTILNTSKEMTAFSDFPIPENYPNFMHHSFLISYLESYCKHFELQPHIKFKHEVIEVRKSVCHEYSGKWEVVVKNLNNDENLVFCFNAVLICNGHHFKPSIPSINGLKLFKGEVIHTHSYKTPTNYSNKTVVVIGFGNSAVDAACDLALVCEKIYLSTRSGGWIQSRLGPAGYPFDGIYNTRAFRYLLNYLPPVIVSKLAERRANQRFDHEMFGVKSSHHIFSKQFIVSDFLPVHLATGKITMRPDIQTITENGVIFNRESKETRCDAIIFATGYHLSFPFLSREIFSAQKNKVNLYLNIFIPHLEYPQTLAFIGLLQPVGSFLPVVEMQCRYFAQLIKDKCKLPSTERMLAEIAADYEKKKSDFDENSEIRHSLRVEFIPYMDRLASEIGAKPNLWRLFFTDFKLWFHLMFGPCVSYQYRLFGPNKWREARKTIIRTNHRIRAAFSSWCRKSEENVRRDANFNNQICNEKE